MVEGLPRRDVAVGLQRDREQVGRRDQGVALPGQPCLLSGWGVCCLDVGLRVSGVGFRGSGVGFWVEG